MADLTSLVPGAPGDWRMEIARKTIRHIYFRVYPQKKLVKISAPKRIGPDELDAAIRAKSSWLLRQVNRPVPVPRAEPVLEEEGEIRFRGQAYPLRFTERRALPNAAIDNEGALVVQTRPGATPQKKMAVLDGWLRQCLKDDIKSLLTKWEPVMGVTAADFGVKKMKTRWGSCNTRAGRIWLNFALIRLAPHLLEYVLVHELVHLLEPSHNRRFYGFMARFLPGWQACKNELDRYSPRYSPGTPG